MKIRKNDKEIREGDKIRLKTKGYGVGPNNPVKGTRFECEGTVQTIRPLDMLPIIVQWANGHINKYSEGDLKHTKKASDNYKSIW